jgi:hypothetical protein
LSKAFISDGLLLPSSPAKQSASSSAMLKMTVLQCHQQCADQEDIWGSEVAD